MVSKMERALANGSVRKLLLFAVTALLVISCLGVIGVSPVGNAKAASTTFSVASEEVNVTVVRDGSVNIDYHFHFTGVSGLDGVDIGMPNTYYDAASATANIVVQGTDYAPVIAAALAAPAPAGRAGFPLPG